MNNIKNPHDKFFKEVFTHKNLMEEFLLNYLPGNIIEQLDLKSLEYTKDSFIDKDLAEYFSDLLCKSNFKDGTLGYIYILFEHKSYQKPLAAFHILRYMVKIWELWLKNEKEQWFPVVIPIILYHGENSWRAGLNFADLIHHHEDMASLVPNFTYILWDASRYSDEEIKGQAMLRVALLIMKYILRKDLREHLRGILGLLKNLSQKRTGMEYIETLLRYILSAAPKSNVTYEGLKDAVSESLPCIGGEIMQTVADSLREQGIQQGIQQGMQEGIQQGIQQDAREAVIDIIEMRFKVVPESIVKALNDIADSAILKMLRRKAVKTKSLNEFGEIIQSTIK